MRDEIKRKMGLGILCLLLCAASVAESGGSNASGGLTAEELAVEAPGESTAVLVTDVKEVLLNGIVQFAYQDEQGRYVVDVMESEKTYMGIQITTPEGVPVYGAMPEISMKGASGLLLVDPITNEDGVMSFGVEAGPMGLDLVTAEFGGEKLEFAINVISLDAAGFPRPQVIEGGISWTDLMSATLDYSATGVVASFPDVIKAKAGETVKISGFMTPLQPDLRQSHFLLTSNPSSCYFHIPGGPAGSVEVLTKEGVEVSWDPIVLEGRFEPQERGEYGVVYRLLDARLVKP